MPRKKRSSSPMELYDDEFDEDASSQSSQPPMQRNAANARERMRMRVLSSAYGRLKTKLPNIPPDTKLSKLDTLRLATLYIKQLINAVETGAGVGAGAGAGGGNANPHSSAAAMADARNHATDCGSSAGGVPTSFSFHNAGQLGMSWPFEFHQHLQHGHNRSSSNSNVSFCSSRMDWQNAQIQSYPKATHHESHVASEPNYTPMQSGQWYPAEMNMQLDQPRNGNSCCAYESASMGQHQRGISIATSQAHGL